MKTEDARKVAVAIGIIATSLTGFHAHAFAASGRINIQTAPEGARYLIVTKKDLSVVKAGTSPYFDTAFPTGKYKVCFEMDGYVTVWQDSNVATLGSSWVGPVMEPLKSAARTTCEDEVARMQTELGIIKSSLAETVIHLERDALSLEGTSQDAAPAVAPILVEHGDAHDNYNYSPRAKEAGDIRDRLENRPPAQR